MTKKSNIPVSQIFLSLIKGRTINDYGVFVRSRDLFNNITTKYNLFDDKKADTLMRKYPEFYSMWKNVRYDIMKVDILRFVILYHYGGFASDLDVLPITEDLNEVLKKNLTSEDNILIFTPKRIFNYEVIYSKKGNPYFLDFLRYVKEQIDIKSKLKIYDTWKGRFVLQTTGPRSFKRFITLYKNPQLKYVEINSLITPADLENTKKNIYKYPFITLQTSSWLESVGTSKGDKIVKQKYRDELFGKDFF